MVKTTNLLHNSVYKVLSSFGYELNPAGQHRELEKKYRVLFENFKNLSGAYEQRVCEADGVLSGNERRAALLSRLLGTPPSEAYYLIQALELCLEVPGDVCEFGVAQGETSALMANEILATTKRLHLFDSFEGLPKPTEKDILIDDIFNLGSMEAYAGTMSNPESKVLARLKQVGFPAERYLLHKGFIEEVLGTDRTLPTQVSFAYVDFDFYEPIRVALEFLDPLMPKGARVVVDDYDFFSTGVKTAVEEFLKMQNANAVAYELFVPDKKYGHFAILTKV